MTYINARRAGLTSPGKVEVRRPQDPKYSVEVRPGYQVLLNPENPPRPNRVDRRSRRRGRGFLRAAAYRKVRSLKTKGIHPAQIWSQVYANMQKEIA